MRWISVSSETGRNKAGEPFARVFVAIPGKYVFSFGVFGGIMTAALSSGDRLYLPLCLAYDRAESFRMINFCLGWLIIGLGWKPKAPPAATLSTF